MRRLACPYCYHRIDGARLWFQCSGRGSATRDGCKPSHDDARERETGFKEPTRPAFAPPPGRRIRSVRVAYCPACWGKSGIRVCPCCHTPLPPNFGESRSPLIAMIGAKGTGKTVYLTALAQGLRRDLSRRFDADVRLSGDSQGGYASPLKWLTQNIDHMFRQHLLFPTTEPAHDGRREPVVFEWRRAHRVGWLPSRYRTRYRTSYLSFYDTAGEDLGTQQSAYDLSYLGAADALILLLDPFMLPRAAERLNLPGKALTSSESTLDSLSRATDSLRVSRGVRADVRIDIPVAVAFAKMDAFFHLLSSDHAVRRLPTATAAYDETLGQATHEHVRALLHDWGGDDIDRHLRFNYATFRYFAVSSLGAPPDYDAGTVTLSGVHPHRVDEPLLWLLSQFHVVPARDHR
jgi:hypothetical protein